MKLLSACVLFALISLTRAEPDLVVLPVAVGAGTDGNATAYLRGEIESVSVLPPAGNTAECSVVVYPYGGLSAIDLVTITNIAAQFDVRPRIDGTGADGAALSSDPPGRVVVAGDAITFAVTNASATNVTYQAFIKILK